MGIPSGSKNEPGIYSNNESDIRDDSDKDKTYRPYEVSATSSSESDKESYIISL